MKPKFPDYYGENLDAIWDILSTITEPIDIKLINSEKLIENLDEYGEAIIKVFKDVALENKHVLFEII